MTDEPVTSETTDLTVIDGVGDAVADDLRDAGYETVGAVADAQLAGVADISGVGDTTAHDIIVHALELINGSTDADEQDDLTALTAPFVIDDGDGVEFTLEIAADVFPYVIHVVLEEAVSQQQSNSFALRDDALRCASALERAHLSDVGPQYGFTATEGTITTLYRALKRGAADYQGRSGITSRYAELRAIADQLNEYR